MDLKALWQRDPGEMWPEARASSVRFPIETAENSWCGFGACWDLVHIELGNN